MINSIEEDLIKTGLYMVLAETRKQLYKETNSSEEVEAIHSTIIVIKNLINKRRSKNGNYLQN